MLRVKKNVSNMKILVELERTPLKINTEKQLFEYLLLHIFLLYLRFAFTEKERCVFKAFQEENEAIDGWVKYMNTKL